MLTALDLLSSGTIKYLCFKFQVFFDVTAVKRLMVFQVDTMIAEQLLPIGACRIQMFHFTTISCKNAKVTKGNLKIFIWSFSFKRLSSANFTKYSKFRTLFIEAKYYARYVALNLVNERISNTVGSEDASLPSLMKENRTDASPWCDPWFLLFY